MNIYFHSQTAFAHPGTDGTNSEGGSASPWPVAQVENAPSFLQAVAVPTDYARLMEERGYKVCRCVDKDLIERKGAQFREQGRGEGISQMEAVKTAAGEAQTAAQGAIRHVESEYHEFLNSEVPLLSYLLARVVERHAIHYPEMWELQGSFAEFEEQLTTHLTVEQRTLFPLLKGAVQGPLGTLEGANLEQVLCSLRRNHVYFRQTLENLRSWTHDFAPPETACTVYRVVIQGMGELRRRMEACIAAEQELYIRAEKELLGHPASTESGMKLEF